MQCVAIVVKVLVGKCLPEHFDFSTHCSVAVSKQNMSSFYWRRQGGCATRDVVGGACLR